MRQLRQISLTGWPTSASLRIDMICVSVNSDSRMRTSWLAVIVQKVLLVNRLFFRRAYATSGFINTSNSMSLKLVKSHAASARAILASTDVSNWGSCVERIPMMGFWCQPGLLSADPAVHRPMERYSLKPSQVAGIMI